MTDRNHARTQTVAVRKRIPFDRGAPYDCPELRRNPGIPDDRFEAFSLPSIINGQRVLPRRTP